MYYDIDHMDYACGGDRNRGVSAFRDVFNLTRGKWIRKHILSRAIDDLLKGGEFAPTSWDIADQLRQAHKWLLESSASVYLNEVDVLSKASDVLVRVCKCFDFRAQLVDEASDVLQPDEIDLLAKFATSNRIKYDEAFCANPLRCIKQKTRLSVDHRLWYIAETLCVRYGVSKKDIDAEYVDSLMLELLHEGGHMYIPLNVLRQVVSRKARSISFEDVLLREDYFARDTGMDGESVIYRLEDHTIELSTAELLSEIMDTHSDPSDDDQSDDDGDASVKEDEWLTAEQDRALQSILYKTSLLAVAGYPGTGKSRLVGETCKQYVKNQHEDGLLVLAPTGKAVDRLRCELRGIIDIDRVMTIHRSFTCDYDENLEPWPQRTFVQKASFVIVDEMSMVSASLFYSLLNQLQSGVRLMLLGDPDQLPSIDRGEVFSQILSSGAVPVVRLTKNFRQSTSGSTIWPLAETIRDSEKKIKTSYLKSESVEWIETSDKKTIIEELKRIYRTEKRVQILMPMNIGPVGIHKVNAEIHAMLYGELPASKPTESDIRKMLSDGDRVIITKNDKGQEYFNGQIGVLHLKEDDEGNTVYRVKVDGEREESVEVDLNHVTMAYGISVHKSQGSEYDVVAIVLHMDHRRMLSTKLVYTGITRCKKKLYVIADRDALHYAKQNRDPPRYSLLAHMLTR